MDAKTWFWTAALLNMALMAGIAVRGIRLASRGEVARHRRHMLVAVALVFVFIGSYVLKVVFLGHEDFDTWSPAAVHTLRFHELCVLVMIVGGGIALQRGHRMRASREATGDPSAAPAPAQVLRLHRLAGRIAVGSAILGFLAACLVLAGMIARLPG